MLNFQHALRPLCIALYPLSLLTSSRSATDPLCLICCSLQVVQEALVVLVVAVVVVVAPAVVLAAGMTTLPVGLVVASPGTLTLPNGWVCCWVVP